MTINASCSCGKTFRVKDELAGKKVKCSACGQPFTVPAPSIASPSSVAGPVTSCACGAQFRVTAKIAGKKVRCPKCKTICQMPAMPAAAGAVAAQAVVAQVAAPVTSSQIGSFDKRSLCYKTSNSAESVLSDMVGLRKIDDEAERKSRLWSLVGILGIVVIVIGVICAFAELLVAGVTVGVIGVVIVIAGFSLKAIHRRLDIDDRRYEVVSGLLSLLSKDMAADAQVSVALDFRPHNHAAKLQRSGKVGYWNAKFFVDRWLELGGRFIDGTKYTVTIIEKQQDRHRTKRSASGKIKHKYKTKNSSEAIVSLKIKQKRYPQAQDLYGKVGETIQLPAWVQLKSVKTEGDLLTLRTTTTTTWDARGPDEKNADHDGVNWMAMMFLSLYRILNDAK
ncbi:MAG: hypothetical protein ABGX22_15980 [Pirellulaceae bacterium]